MINILKRFTSVYYRLMISYIIVVLFITVALGISSYKYFSSNFNTEVEKVNHKMLDFSSKTIRNEITRKAEEIYLRIATDQLKNSDLLYFFDNPIEGNHARISHVYDFLKTGVSSASNIVDSIQIFYKKNNLLISSSNGMIVASDNYLNINFDWLDKIEKENKNTLWISTRKVDAPLPDNSADDIVTLVRSYPPTSYGNNSKGYIAVNIKESAIYDIISQTTTGASDKSKGHLFLMDTKGHVISHSNTNDLYKNISNEDYVRDILSSDINGNFIQDVNGTKSMVSFTSMENEGWILVNITPIDEFYNKSVIIQKTLLLFCIIAILLGIIIANVLTFRMYNPLKKLIEQTKKLFLASPNVDEDVENEYIFINNVITDLSTKVGTLEQTLKTNMPLIKHNLVSSLINNRIKDSSVLNEREKLLGIKFEGLLFYSLLIQLDENKLNTMEIEHSQFIKYNLIEYIENCSNRKTLYLSADISDSRIAVIANIENDSTENMYRLAEQINTYVQNNFNIKSQIGIGSLMDTPFKLYVSYGEALNMLKYRYLLVQNQIFPSEIFLKRELSKSEIASSISNNFLQGLKSSNPNLINTVLDSFIAETINGDYSFSHCEHKIKELISIFTKYLKEINYSSYDIGHNDLFKELYELENILQFKEWLTEIIKETFNFIESKNKSRISEIIEYTKGYIIENLEDNISLNIIAEKVGLTPHYLSKVFKEEAGINFIEFITNAKMKKASELILSSDLSIEEISQKLGYGSSAYFIKKFKESYGVTPKQYKYNHTLS